MGGAIVTVGSIIVVVAIAIIICTSQTRGTRSRLRVPGNKVGGREGRARQLLTMTGLRMRKIDHAPSLGIGAIGNANAQAFPRHGYDEDRAGW